MRRVITVVLAASALCLGPGVASAAGGQAPGQASEASPRPPGRSKSFIVLGGIDWLGGMRLGTSAATLTSNTTGRDSSFTLFDSEGRRMGAPAVSAGLGFHVTRDLALEGRFAYSRPDLRVYIRNDAEKNERLTFTGNRMSQYTVDAAAVYYLRRLAFSKGRVTPFVQAGGGYLRQLHDGNLAIDTGQSYFGGGGVHYYLTTRRRGLVTGMAIRADVRLCYQRKGYNFDGSGRAFPAAGAALVFSF